MGSDWMTVNSGDVAGVVGALTPSIYDRNPELRQFDNGTGLIGERLFAIANDRFVDMSEFEQAGRVSLQAQSAGDISAEASKAEAARLLADVLGRTAAEDVQKFTTSMLSRSVTDYFRSNGGVAFLPPERQPVVTDAGMTSTGRRDLATIHIGHNY